MIFNSLNRFIKAYALVLLITIYVNAQPVMFNKTFPVYGNAAALRSQMFAEQLPDNGYLFAGSGNIDSLVRFCKTDSIGNILWQTKIQTTEIFQDMVLGSDNHYYLCLSHSLLKLDRNINTIWSKKLDTLQYMPVKNMYAIEQVGNHIITAGINSQKEMVLKRFSVSGDIIWEKHILTDQSFQSFSGIQVRDTKDDGFAVLICRRLYKFNSAGDTLWSRLFPKVNWAFAFENSEYLISGEKSLRKLDAAGNTLWSKIMKGNYSDICTTEDNNFVLSGSSLIKINSSGETIWERLDIYRSRVTATSDNGFLVSSTGPYINAAKTDDQGILKTIQLRLTDSVSVVPGKDFIIEWYQHNFKEVRIEYSTDEGKSWINIEENYFYFDSSSYSYKYKWGIPSGIGATYLLRISDIHNLYVYDILKLKTAYNLHADYISINNIKMWLDNTGIGSFDPSSDGSGLYWPGGENAKLTAIFSDGLVWGGFVKGELKVNGSLHRSGLKPGKILEDGKAGDPDKLEYNIWRLKKDWHLLPEGADRNRYEYNYYNWPAQNGAPYEDVNGDGKFSRETDIPKVYGDETFWFVANDLDTAQSKFLLGSNPLGVEMQCTVYGFNRTDELGDVIFKKYKLINKSGQKIEKLCVGYWSDPDLGFASDDYVGCDTTLDFGFVYNSDNNDEGYYGENPPAAGYLLLDSPLMTGFIFYIGGSSTWHDPYLGTSIGSTHLYNYLNSKLPDGDNLIDPITNQVSKFWLPGDPVTGAGWHQGAGGPQGKEAGDMRMLLRTGPYDIFPEDTVKITVAIILARGADHINSVKFLKDKAKAVRNFYYHGILNEMKTDKEFNLNYSLEQNYPNPFNPATTIRYSLPEKAVVEIAVYDILGKKVATLVDEEKPAGVYSVKFKAHSYASGVYYYVFKTKDYLSTRKMVLIK